MMRGLATPLSSAKPIATDRTFEVGVSAITCFFPELKRA